MSDPIVPLADILYVFDVWTLMVRAPEPHDFKAGDRVILLNSDKEPIGEAILRRYLSSRDPNMSGIQIEPLVSPEDFKQVKFFKVQR